MAKKKSVKCARTPRPAQKALPPQAAAPQPPAIIHINAPPPPPPPRDLKDEPSFRDEAELHGGAEGRVLDDDVWVALQGLGELQLTEAEISILTAPADQAVELEILPTGEVYMGHVHVRRRLIRAFGPGGWGLAPLSRPRIQGNTVVLPWGIKARGKFLAMAWGEASFYDNARITEATPLEASKSNALTRCAKDLGIGLECWDRRFTQRFRAEHCVCVRVRFRKNVRGSWEDKEEWRWRLKTAEPFEGEVHGQTRTGYQGDTAGEDRDGSFPSAGQLQDNPNRSEGGGYKRKPVPITDAQRERLYKMVQRAGRSEDEVKAYLKACFGLGGSREILQTDYDAICDQIMTRGPLPKVRG